MQLTTRNRNIISGLIALVLLFSAITVGVKWSFGAFDDVYPLNASFDAAGQGLQKGSDIKIRGVNVGKVSTVKLVDGRALVTMELSRATKVPITAIATVRAKTLFGEKFVDVDPGPGETTGPYYPTDDSAMLPNDRMNDTSIDRKLRVADAIWMGTHGDGDNGGDEENGENSQTRRNEGTETRTEKTI